MPATEIHPPHPRRSLLALAPVAAALLGLVSLGAADEVTEVTLAGETREAENIDVGAQPPDQAVVLIGDGALPVWNAGGTSPENNLDESELEELGDDVPVDRGDGDLITRTEFGDARLHVEWLSPPGGEGQMGGNSGVYLQGRYEIQVLNNGSHDDLADNEAGGIYTVKAADVNASNGPGEWQSYDIWFKAPRFKDGEKVEPARVTVLWNGKLIHDDVEVPNPTGGGMARGEGAGPETDYQIGPLILQDHATAAEGPVRYRNVWIAPLGGEEEPEWSDWQPLVEGDALDDFDVLGGQATFSAEDGVITGTTAPNTPNTFLATKTLYDDFELEAELKGNPELNSGIQIRSTTEDGSRNREARVTGYQVEIDPDPNRRWSGGIYDEAGRAWLYPLVANPEAREAFKIGEWNTYRIVARGPVIRTWVNDVPAAQVFDALRPEGFIAFQVHGVGDRQDPLRIQWRNVRVRTPE